MGHRLTATVALLAVLALVMAPSALADDDLDKKIEKAVKAATKKKDTDFKVYWRNGLNLKAGDGKFEMKIGGRVQLDCWFFDDDNIRAATGGDLAWNSGFEFRRVRLFVSGTAYKYVMWKLQIDFAGECDNDREVTFKDVYIGVHNLEDCFGCLAPDIKVGHFKEFFSLEELTSSKHITFMERSLPVEAFAPSRNTGIGLFLDFLAGRGTLGLGIWHHNTSDCGHGFWRADGREGGYDITGRLTGLLWAPCDCESSYFHLGASASYQADFQAVRYRSRPEVHLGPRIANTGDIATDNALLWGAEMAFNYWSFHLQGEYISAIPDAPLLGDPVFMGYYVEASWTFGGFRPFKRSEATLDKVKPCNDWLDCNCCGMGAWEIAARYSYLDLTDGLIAGGEVSDITVGLNWYINPNAVTKLNYVLSNLKNSGDYPGVDESLNAFGIRFQVYF